MAQSMEDIRDLLDPDFRADLIDKLQDPAFQERLVDKVNRKVNVPLIGESTEARIYRGIIGAAVEVIVASLEPAVAGDPEDVINE